MHLLHELVVGKLGKNDLVVGHVRAAPRSASHSGLRGGSFWRQSLSLPRRLSIADLRLPAKGKRQRKHRGSDWISCRFCDRPWRWRAVSGWVHGYDLQKDRGACDSGLPKIFEEDWPWTTRQRRAEQEATSARRARGDRGGGAAARRAARSGGGPGLQLTYIRRKIKRLRGARRGRPGADRERMPTPCWRKSASISATTPRRCSCGKRPAPTSRASACISRAGLPRSLLKTAPPIFTQHARNPERSVQIGGNATVFAPVYGPPFVRDLDGRPPLRARSRISAIS